MPASRPSSNSCLMPVLLLTAMLALSGCVGPAVKPPVTPDETLLAPAEQALAKARAADADTFAPRAVDASRRRIATARDILFDAARTDRPLGDTERQRVAQLVDAAELDARSALVQTQAKAVRTKLAELRGQGVPASGQSEVSP